MSSSENVTADNLARDFVVLAVKGRIVLVGTSRGKPADATFGIFGA
jgi:hypothetical protein